MRTNINLPRYHEELTLDKFTCFSKQTLNFVDDINVFVGENGTGKTHVMKVLYAVQKASAALRSTSLQDDMRRAFQIDDFADFISKDTRPEDRRPDAIARIAGVYDGQIWQYLISSGEETNAAKPIRFEPQPELPVFIPSIDMMGHSRGFLESANLVELDFDSTCSD